MSAMQWFMIAIGCFVLRACLTPNRPTEPGLKAFLWIIVFGFVLLNWR